MVKEFVRITACALFFTLSFFAQAEDDNFTTSHFSGSGNCASCHDGLTDTAGDDVSIVRDWSASMMANSTKDPFWQAKVATELERNPHLTPVINDRCTECHAPMANVEIVSVQNDELTLFGPSGILDPDHELHDAAMNGVSCTVCHQIEDDAALGTLEGKSGNYRINDSKTIYGQYSDITGQPMINNTGYTPAFSEHISDSALCATCHDLKTPYVDAEGNMLTTTLESEFPEQMPYTEWQNSIFDDAGSNPQSCQDCHMPKTTAKVSNRPRWLGTKDGFAKHELVGANTTMLTLLKNNAALLDVNTANMDVSISRAREMLQSSVDLELLSVSVDNGVLEARVKLQNNSGHKTPTGYPSRRMWLNFKLTDSDNSVIFESGKVNADGSIAGADNDIDSAAVEPHYQLISSADQVQIYEPVMGDSDGNVTYTLLRGAQYLKDNRLTPRGFNKFAVPEDVAVRGLAFDDENFNQGSDELTYRIPVEVSGEINVSVSLNYQTIAFGFLQDLYRDDHLEQVQTFKDLYDTQTLKYEQIASVQTTVVSDGGGITPIPPVPVANLSVTPATIEQGESATLSWTSSDADSCMVSGGWLGSRAISGSEVVTPALTTSYTITCDGDGGSASDSVTVTVNQPPAPVPVANLSVTPATIEQGQSATLSWTSSDADSCMASGGWLGSRATSGSEVVIPALTTSYTITCDGDGGTASDSVTVTVNEPPSAIAPTLNLTASPSSIRRGQPVTLNWSSSDAASCVASGAWSGVKPASGSQSVVLDNTSTLTLTCTGDGGSVTDSVTYQARGRWWLNLQ